MEDQKDRFGEKMRLVERAKEDIYFAEKDCELIEKLKARLKKVERSQGQEQQLECPKCQGNLESYAFMEVFLDRCQSCGGLWLDKGELEGILKRITRSPLASLITGGQFPAACCDILERMGRYFHKSHPRQLSLF